MSWSYGPGQGASLPGPLAGWWRRVGATVIDGIITGLPATVVTVAAPVRVRYLVVIVVQLAYTTTLLARTGQTVGMRAVGTRAVLPGGGLLGVQQALVRTAISGVSNILAVVAPVLGLLAGVFTLLDVLWPLWDANNQTLHDKAVGSLVVRSPAAARRAPQAGTWPAGAPTPQPPWAAQPQAPLPPPGPEASVPAAWYPDPAGSGGERWWDGRSWTDHVRDPA